MAVPVLISMAPVALEIMRVLLSADENAKKHEIARATLELERIHAQLEASRIALDREILQAKLSAYSMLLEALNSTFQSKSDMVQMITAVVLSQHETDKAALRKEQARLQKVLRSSGLKPDRYTMARLDLARTNERVTELDGRFADVIGQLQATISALAPADFVALDRLRGLLA